MLIKCKVLEVLDNYVVVENSTAMWWLGKETFKLPKDTSLKNAKEGDIVNMEIS